MHWYALNIRKDKEEEFIMYRDLLEYALSFYDHKTVTKIKENRKAREEVSDKQKEDEFVESFKNKEYAKFGKLSDIAPEVKTNNKKNNVDNKIKYINKLLGD